jgi:hypothetical protein
MKEIQRLMVLFLMAASTHYNEKERAKDDPSDGKDKIGYFLLICNCIVAFYI